MPEKFIALKNKSTSLPKVKGTQQNHYASRKPLKQIHRVRWSIAPKCLIEGHEGKEVMYICINPTCNQITRLVCQTCFFKNHALHNKQFLAIDEIKKGDVQKLRYWPFDKKFRPIFEFILRHESYIHNMVQDVNATFQGMAMRVLSTIDKIRLKLLKKIDTFYLKQTIKQEFSDKIREELQRCFELKQIQEIVRQIFTKQIKHEVFAQKMKQLLTNTNLIKNREALLNLFITAKKGKDMTFDKTYFLKKQNWLIEQVQQQQKTLRETDVTIDPAQIGIQTIITQAMAYLQQQAEGKYPLTFEKKVLEDGSQYIGFMSKSIRTLFGMRKYKNEYNYYGEWRINARNGWGVYENKSNGYKYTGYWKEDKKSGFGRQQTLTSIYEGNFIADKKQGYGVSIQGEVRYEIGWKSDKKHGAGKKIDRNGEEKEIYYLNGIEANMKSTKSSHTISIKELSLKFGAKSIETDVNQN